MLRLLLCAACAATIGNLALRCDAGERSKRSGTPDVPVTVRLIEADWKGVQKLGAAQKGKVVVVDVWTSTCAACVKKFPRFAALQKKHGNKVACISVNCDFDGVPGKPPKHYRKHVLDFLRKQQASFDNVMLNVPFLGFLNQIKLESTPALFVYDKTGRLTKRFDNDKSVSDADDFTMKQVESLVESLITR
ncbi:MAG: TlpA family protein disulfide reductase [Planctomycetaceae bacterium]